MNNKFILPIRKFEDTEETIENSNFHKVKILIMHTGSNYNDSIFSEESIDNSIITLPNIPILGFVYTDDNGNKDFKGHESDLDVFVDDDGKVKVREFYKEIPIGVIPETNEYFKEEIDGEIYLGCYGYIWKCYSNDAYDILIEDEEKEVSMEILIKKCTYDDNGKCNVNEFEFLGVTVLGSRVNGAMGEECVMNMNFSAEEKNKEFFESVDKLNKILKCQRKEGISMDNEKNPIENTSEFAEDKKDEVCDICGKNPCECDKEEEACKKKKMEDDTEDKENKEEESCKKKKMEDNREDNKEEEACKKKKMEDDTEEDDDDIEDDEVCDICGKNPCECDKEEEACKKKKMEKESFSLSLNNTFKALDKSLKDIVYTYTSYWGDTFENRKYYVEDLIPDESIAVLYDCEDGECYGVKYTVSNDDVVCDLENVKLYIREWRPKLESNSNKFECENISKKETYMYDMFTKEIHDLREFKSNIENEIEKESLNESIDNVLSQFSFEEEEISDLKEKVYNKKIDIDMFETLLFAKEAKKLRLEKENFSKNQNDNSLNIVDTNNEDNIKKVSKYDAILKKYGKKNK